MTTEFSSKEDALFFGLYSVGRDDIFKGRRNHLALDDVLKAHKVKVKNDLTIQQFGVSASKDALAIEVESVDGFPVTIIITKLINSWSCWIGQNGEMAIRV